MPLSKEDLNPKAPQAAEEKPAESAPKLSGRRAAQLAAADVPEPSPSAHALEKVKDLDPEEAGERYQREKAKRRWG